MKFKFFTFLLLSLSFLSFAYAQEYKTWHLPEGAKMRLGKGEIEDFAFSRDGNELAVSSSTGIWIYSVATGDELALLTGHTARVGMLVFSPDGEILASIGQDRTTRLWDTESGVQLAVLRHKQSSHALIAFSPDGNTIVSGNWNGTIQTWNVATGELLATLSGHTGSIRALALSPDGKTLASASESRGDTAIRLWDISTEEHLSTLEKRHAQSVRMLAFSPDGKTLASATHDDGAAIQVWDVASKKNLFALTGHKQRVSVLTFSPDGKILASAGMGGTIRLWNPETGKQVHALAQLGLTHTDQQVLTATRRAAWINKLLFSPDGSVLVSSDRHGTVQMWNVAEGKSISAWKAHTRSIRALAFSTDKPIFITVDEKGTLHSWHAATGAPSAALTLNGHEDYGWGSALGFSADGKMLRAGSGSTIRSWDTETGSTLEPIVLQSSVASASSFSPNGKTLAHLDAGKQIIHLWDLPDGVERATLTGHTWAVETFSFSPDGSLLATGGREGAIYVWDVETGQRRKSLEEHQIAVKALAFSPDNSTLASANHRGVYLWDIDTENLRTTLIEQEDSGQADTLVLAFSPDGKTLASTMSGKLSLWNVHTHQMLSEIVGDSGRINVLTFSPDSAILLAGHGNGTIEMWDMDTYTRKSTLKPHTGKIEVLKFSPDGRTLVTGSMDGTILLWHWASIAQQNRK